MCHICFSSSVCIATALAFCQSLEVLFALIALFQLTYTHVLHWNTLSNEVRPDDDSALAAALALIAKTGPRRVWQGRCKRQ